MTTDIQFMSRCLALAAKAKGHTSPNPMVGCVIVKNNKIISEGFHKRAGQPHAEIDALQKLKFKAKGATLYVNLEPCFHQGRTPPCVTPVIESGVTRVVIAMRDPNSLVAGKSIRLLRKSGIEVTLGVLKKEAEELNRFFITWMTRKRPYVCLKAALSADGMMALDKPKRPVKITGPKAGKDVHKMRSEFDAVLVGLNTLWVDDPRLNVRGLMGAEQPLRLILDTRLKTTSSSRVFHSKGGTVMMLTCETSPSKIAKIQKAGAAVLVVKKDSKGRVDIKDLLRKLAGQDIISVLVEGGVEVYSSFIRAKAVDEVVLFLSPKVIGPKGYPGLETLRPFFSEPSLKEVQFFGPDLKIIWRK